MEDHSLECNDENYDDRCDGGCYHHYEADNDFWWGAWSITFLAIDIYNHYQLSSDILVIVETVVIVILNKVVINIIMDLDTLTQKTFLAITEIIRGSSML